jgi:predicted AlkP superfamily phosphohydrolase/phosphomutase
MKICILGLDSATPQLIFGDERLANIRRLMELGAYGEIQSAVPPGAVPGWICLAASQDPGSLGIYDLCNRLDYSYSPPARAAAGPVQVGALWDQMALSGKQSIVVAVPPSFPPRPIAGISIGCSLTPGPSADEFTFPAGLKDTIRGLVGDYAADVNFAGQSKDDLREQIFEMSRKQWEVARWLLRDQEWAYFHFVDVGLDRIQCAFWQYFDPQHLQYQPGSPYQEVISDYHLWLDEQVGSVLQLLDAETVLLLVSTNGARGLDGGFAINQWLLQEGLLVLNQPPGPGITPFDQLNVNWARTRAWGGDGPCASVYFNVQGREPQGIIPAQDHEAFRDEIKTRLESLLDDGGRPLRAEVLKPSQLYRQTRNVAPDLIVQLNEGRRSSLGSVGHPGLYVRDLAMGCTPAAPGMFVLTAPNCPLSGLYEGADLLDMAPTVLDLAGYEIPASTQGRSLVAGMDKRRGSAGPDSDQIILDRLAGLGYV